MRGAFNSMIPRATPTGSTAPQLPILLPISVRCNVRFSLFRDCPRVHTGHVVDDTDNRIPVAPVPVDAGACGRGARARLGTGVKAQP